MFTWIILTYTAIASTFFTWFTIQNQWSVWSCSMHAVSHCLNLEAWWNATTGSELWNVWKLQWYWFSDTSGANNIKAMEFAATLTGVVIKKIDLAFVYSGDKLVLSEWSKQEVIKAVQDWKKLFVSSDLNWRWSTWYVINNDGEKYWHATCWFDTATGWIIFVNSWWRKHRNAVWMIRWDDLQYGQLWSIDWVQAPEKPKPKWMILREQHNLKSEIKKVQ